MLWERFSKRGFNAWIFKRISKMVYSILARNLNAISSFKTSQNRIVCFKEGFQKALLLLMKI
jgi:hypothetical protein